MTPNAPPAFLVDGALRPRSEAYVRCADDCFLRPPCRRSGRRSSTSALSSSSSNLCSRCVFPSSSMTLSQEELCSAPFDAVARDLSVRCLCSVRGLVSLPALNRCLASTRRPQHGADANTVGIKEAPDGLDFFYASRSHALKLCDFLQNVVAVRSRADKQLVRASDRC